MKILVIAAHPDDVDFGAGGTIATWIAEGNEVVYCLVTDGQAGGSDNTVTREQVAAIRRQEQTAAANMLGVTELHWLGFPDGKLKEFVPSSPKVLAVMGIVEPGKSQTFWFIAPQKPGTYPYVCTYPSHWRTMNGKMKVVAPPQPAQTPPQPVAAP